MTTITLPRAVVEQALEALMKSHTCPLLPDDCENAITALRAALAQEREPAPMPSFPPVSQWKRGCAVCGIGANGETVGYVCPRYDCPTKVTCGGVV